LYCADEPTPTKRGVNPLLQAWPKPFVASSTVAANDSANRVILFVIFNVSLDVFEKFVRSLKIVDCPVERTERSARTAGVVS
jgi:hypothetical protein